MGQTSIVFREMKHEIKRKRDTHIHLVVEHAGCWMQYIRANSYIEHNNRIIEEEIRRVLCNVNVAPPQEMELFIVSFFRQNSWQ